MGELGLSLRHMGVSLSGTEGCVFACERFISGTDGEMGMSLCGTEMGMDRV